MKKVLVYGWYNHANMGDELFKVAFKSLFPDVRFTFVDKLWSAAVEQHDAVIFGGGSFLYAPINTDSHSILEMLSDKPIYYIGVGVETDIHSIHQKLIKKAVFVATRSHAGEERVQKFANTPVIQIPDIVYSLQSQAVVSSSIPNSILILPNAEVLPNWKDPHWKHSAWNYFKSEFSQTLDELKEDKHTITFAPMCTSKGKHDLGAAAEIINAMSRRNFDEQINVLPTSFDQLSKIISKFELVISQRYHGSILAHICKRPCVVISHHDKLTNPNNSSITVPYYELSKRKMHEAVSAAKNLPIEDIYFPNLEL